MMFTKSLTTLTSTKERANCLKASVNISIISFSGISIFMLLNMCKTFDAIHLSFWFKYTLCLVYSNFGKIARIRLSIKVFISLNMSLLTSIYYYNGYLTSSSSGSLICSSSSLFTEPEGYVFDYLIFP